MTGRRLILLGAALALVGCSAIDSFTVPSVAVPSWVPFLGDSGKPKARAAAPTPAEPPKNAPLLPGTAERPRPAEDSEVIDRVVCVVNNDAITQYELDEAESFYLYEQKLAAPPEGAARRALRDQILARIIDARLQLQQAERERMTVEDVEVSEQIAEVMKRLAVKSEAELEIALKPQGVTVEGIKRRIRETLMVQKVVRRKVALRISVTEEEIDRYLQDNREKLETGLTFEARHMLFLPEPGRGEDGWEDAKRRAEEVHGQLLAGGSFADLARQHSEDGSRNEGGALGALKRGELAPEIEAAILALQVGEVSKPFRSEVGYHLFKLEKRESLAGEGLAQARNQIREILFREKYQARLKDWLADIKQRAMIDMRL